MLKGSQHLDKTEPAGWAAEGVFPATRGGQGLCHVPFMSGFYLLLYVGDLQTNFTLHYEGCAQCLFKQKDLRCSWREH